MEETSIELITHIKKTIKTIKKIIWLQVFSKCTIWKRTSNSSKTEEN